MGFKKTTFIFQRPSHVAFFYESPKDRLSVLAEYFKAGIEQNEACFLVTNEPPKAVVQNLQAVGFDALTALCEDKLQILYDGDVYLEGNKFDSARMLKNVAKFIKSSRRKGFDGVRTAGEMGWILSHPHTVIEAAYYENLVNSLSEAKYLTGMCLYPLSGTSKFVVGSAIHTHPQFIYDSNLYDNPHCAEATTSPESLKEGVETWLTNVTPAAQHYSPMRKARNQIQSADKAIKKLLHPVS